MQSRRLSVPEPSPSRPATPNSHGSSASTSPEEEWRPSIRIRRFPSIQSIPDQAQQVSNTQLGVDNLLRTRNRSSSDPEGRQIGTEYVPGKLRRASYMPNIVENTPSNSVSPQNTTQIADALPDPQTTNTEDLSNRYRSRTTGGIPTTPDSQQHQYESDLVDFLDVVDPEISTLSTLTNVQNSLFIPDLGRLLNRTPTYTLTRRPEDSETTSEDDQEQEQAKKEDQPPVQRVPTGATLTSITSRVDDRHYAVLPHGAKLSGWSPEDIEELNDHVRHMLHSKRSKFKRSMKGFGQYVRQPWVLFLIGWINVGGRQLYVINVIDNVLVALFAVMGDGLAPFRAVDTYHMIFIAHYHHLTWRLRREKALPKLHNRNDLPAARSQDLEDAIVEEEYTVLNQKQQARLVHHQKKFSRSHTFYKPHETTTHHAFPLRLLVAIVVLLDCHSFLQISLGTFNITAGILIMVGDRKTRKKDVLDRMNKQDLTAEAMKKVEKRKEKERQSIELLRHETSLSTNNRVSTERSDMVV
ncbi:hypothetical protein B7494_g5363 [Chlorociboria aeruginascens]|nr:hypothetical protein B7494_g5363 [Chlorociboria aeruginascens]